MLPSRSIEISRMDFPSASAPCSTRRGTHLRRCPSIHLARPVARATHRLLPLHTPLP